MIQVNSIMIIVPFKDTVNLIEHNHDFLIGQTNIPIQSVLSNTAWSQ